MELSTLLICPYIQVSIPTSPHTNTNGQGITTIQHLAHSESQEVTIKTEDKNFTIRTRATNHIIKEHEEVFFHTTLALIKKYIDKRNPHKKIEHQNKVQLKSLPS